MRLTEGEREIFDKVESGAHCGQIGISLRYNNHFWHEVCGTIGTAQGDNLWTIIKVKKIKRERNVNKTNKVGVQENR